ncbi:MAG: universal stress protein [Marine Group I thaumarchaeote]|nr:MAG: universal stress protein [Marine Group I thaumarchaeote]
MIKDRIRRILVPLDGSKNSLRGFDKAIYLARQFGATITGIYVLPRTPEKEFRRIGSIEKDLLKLASSFMGAAKKRAAQNAIVFKEKVTFGDPGYMITKFAEHNKHNLIVIGARGMGSVKRIFLGSVSNYVLHKSKVPVLIVK